ncbi:bifunctional DNA-binding transcriptional regulator/O6-methylguanine-DNA methyltransferase Ada [Massilia scottii]|uniref:bifunctional DNA-binding transcriptional regulator/O6-methylguanine-DNA methyltransferase Ada n=1 Tax=Massilia scottii TaxID=3057166 RepID=UPI0027968A1C|nr:bifunctional DNA-binding transcriptional regulator/O6-methylguanine-DNA methyltransferase Ada [Massilia sp. CCM 9029]MDQ1833232.1 bifunctional DNA-binding transcriptional regulator/O6-methylguanine-DNA methyltransferase Ada [Massilia sp. CCM 9029]
MSTNTNSTGSTGSTGYDNDAARWAAVQRRDAGADGVFYYSVRTTGVYCRPSCGARAALRANVAFHPSGAAAEQAGFRPCLRCKPDQPPLGERHAQMVARACRLIDASEAGLDLDSLAEACGMSRFHFHRVFKHHTGITPKAYAAARRAGKVDAGLATAGSVTEAIYAAGYNSSARFYASAPARLGMTPTAWRAGGSGAVIRFAIGACSLGAILVASTDKGICAILIGDDPELLARDLQDRFPAADLRGADAGFEATVARVVGLVEAPGVGLDLPLDVRGTAFQQRVWQALRDIPAGQTVSYAELAARIGLPAGARAIAGACAANPVAVAIPCHRVVRTDGTLSGYRWGVERKRILLERESGDGGAA